VLDIASRIIFWRISQGMLAKELWSVLPEARDSVLLILKLDAAAKSGSQQNEW